MNNNFKRLMEHQKRINLLHRLSPIVGRELYERNLNIENARMAREYENSRLLNVKRSISPGTVRNRVRSLSPSPNSKSNQTRKNRKHRTHRTHRK